MQCAYLNYLIKKNNVSSARLEEASGLSPATLSRVKTGQRELSPDEFKRVVSACGGDEASYKAFMSALEGTPVVKMDESVSIATVRQFYQKQLDDVEHRLLAEMDRLKEHHAQEREKAQQLHAKAIERMESHHNERVAELKEDLRQARAERDDAKKELKEVGDTLEKIHNSRGRWRLAFCVLMATYATQWLLDWLVFKDIGFILTALRNRVDTSINILRG